MKITYEVDIKEIGSLIFRLRNENNLKQTELAEKIDCASTTICAIESGRKQIPLKWLKLIFGYFGYDMKIIFTKIKNYDSCKKTRVKSTTY
jgi:DNA-binding XRE family transcriptional regulator